MLYSKYIVLPIDIPGCSRIRPSENSDFFYWRMKQTGHKWGTPSECDAARPLTGIKLIVISNWDSIRLNSKVPWFVLQCFFAETKDPVIKPSQNASCSESCVLLLVLLDPIKLPVVHFGGHAGRSCRDAFQRAPDSGSGWPKGDHNFTGEARSVVWSEHYCF